MVQHNNIKEEERVSLRLKLYYSVGSFGSYILFAVVLNSVIFFYEEEVLLSSIHVLWAFIFYSILNAISGVIFGWLSDRTKTKKGRRIPYLRYFAPLLSVSFVLIWICPSIGEIGEVGVLIWMIVTLAVFDVFYTTINMAYSALGQELSMDNKERVNIQVFIMIFGIFSVIIALVLPLSVLENYGREGFIIFASIVSIIQLVTLLITAFKVKERLEFSQVDEPLGLRDSFKHTVKNRAFLTIAFVNFCIQFIQGVLFGNIFFYISYIFIDYSSSLVLILIGVFLLSGLFIGIYYMLKINKTRGLKPALIQSLGFVSIGLFLVGILPGLFGTLGFLFFGLGLFGIMALVNVAYGSVADEDEVKNGTRREAAIFGANALVTKPAQSLAGVFIAFMLTIFQYQPPIGEIQQPQSDLTLLGFRLAMGIIPCLIILSSLLIFRLYPLHGTYLAQIKTKMYELHQEKREKLKTVK